MKVATVRLSNSMAEYGAAETFNIAIERVTYTCSANHGISLALIDTVARVSVYDIGETALKDIVVRKDGKVERKITRERFPMVGTEDAVFPAAPILLSALETDRFYKWYRDDFMANHRGDVSLSKGELAEKLRAILVDSDGG